MNSEDMWQELISRLQNHDHANLINQDVKVRFILTDGCEFEFKVGCCCSRDLTNDLTSVMMEQPHVFLRIEDDRGREIAVRGRNVDRIEVTIA